MKTKTDKGIEEVKQEEIIKFMRMVDRIWKWEPLVECLKNGGKKREKRAIIKNLAFL